MSRPSQILIDTSLLVLLVVGLTSRRLVLSHKKTKSFTVDDFDLLSSLVGETPIVIIPNVASETSNLLAFHDEPEKRMLFRTFAVLIDRHLEILVSSKDVVRQAEFAYLGVTDTAILCAAGARPIVTTDAMLHHSALRKGLRAINFYHLREPS